MPNFLQVLLNNAQLLFFILVFLLPMLGGLLRWIESQRERRRRQAALERQRLEALRTGRADATPSPTTLSPAPARAASPSREEIAARRQREMQERLRQRLEQQRRASAPAPANPAPTRAPTTRAPTTIRPRPGAGAPQSPPTARPAPGRAYPPPPVRQPQRPQRERARPQQRQQRQQRREPLPVPPPQRIVPLSPTLRQPSEVPGANVAAQEIGSAREAAGLHTTGPAVRIGPGLSIQRLREAVILREVLDRPLALRESATDLFD